jgi:hypothetical protein
VQHWLKVLHRFRADQSTFGDPHRLSPEGEPLMRPAYEPGDLALVYVAGTYRCPGIAEVLEPAAFDPAQRRWGWRTAVRVVGCVPLEQAPPLEAAGIPRVAVGRQSRLRLRPEQFAAAAPAILRER